MTSGHILAIKQIPPDATTLLPGRIYLLAHDEYAPMQSLAWTTLMAAGEFSSAKWVAAGDVDGELGTGTAVALRMQKSVRTGKVRVLVRRGEAKCARLLEEIDFYGIEKNALIVFDHADGTFTDPQALLLLRAFAEEKECTLLLLCPTSGAGTWPQRGENADRLAGIAHFHRAAENLLWDISHWHGKNAAIANVSFLLTQQADGTLSAEAATTPLPPQQESSGDENEVYITRAALSGKTPPESWTVLDDYDALEAATACVTAASIILHFNQFAKFETLTHLVFKLRQSCGGRVKILVREVNLHLRYSQEQLLLKLGANLVIPAEVLFSRIISFVGMVQGQIYPRVPEADFDQAMNRIMPARKQGYLSPKIFIETVNSVLAKVESLSIRNALIKLPLAIGISPLIAIRSCWMKRPGDFCTADEDSVYVFLFACRESDIDLSLDRQFAFPLQDLFGLEVRFLTTDSIKEGMAELAALEKAGKCPEIDLDSIEMDERPPAQKQLMSASPDEIIRRSAPTPAVKRPLPLKAAV